MGRVIVASAGSGKTQWMVESAGGSKSGRVLVTTYTRANTASIVARFGHVFGAIPKGVEVASWFSFLIRDAIRPYQRAVVKGRIGTICPVSGVSQTWSRRGEAGYFVDRTNRIYSDKLSDFATFVDGETSGAVVNRIRKLYRTIYIDEAQDMSGYDLEFVELLLKGGVNVVMVGDCRQATYATNQSRKNKKFRGEAIILKFQEWERKGLCDLESRNYSFRCNQEICNVADRVFPDYSATESRQSEESGHDGVFVVRTADLDAYLSAYSPQALRYDRRTKAGGMTIMNYGYSKGLEFERVLVLPNGKVKGFLRSGSGAGLVSSTACKLYVAITRAKYSLAFLYDGSIGLTGVPVWSPSDVQESARIV